MAGPNRLRRKRWEKRRKDRDMTKTVEEVFDIHTLQHIRRLEWKGIVWELKGVVSSGKEARVYWAKSKDGRDLAVKIYLSATAEFRHGIYKYIVGDPRFERVPKGNFRRLIYEWTRKEYRNLRRMHEAGVRVPRPIAFSGNVLVMEFLGEEGYRAPLLAEIIDELGEEKINRLYVDVVDNIEAIVCRAGLVHADLSEYNVMVWRGRAWIIDVSQAVEHNHPMAREFLERDLANITRFFSRYTDLDLRQRLEAVRKCLHE
ncbi:MAG: serine protein kinase RIO [Desulfurococcales archaeon]|nr:serine protein kinase RIO [Desulfurococcales archaeon]